MKGRRGFETVFDGKPDRNRTGFGILSRISLAYLNWPEGGRFDKRSPGWDALKRSTREELL